MDGPCDYGHFDIVLADFLKQNSISKNQLSEKANLQRTQLNSYCKNNIKRPDLDVLARICYALNGVLLHFQILSHVGSVWKPAYMMWRQNRLEKS